MEYKIAKIGKIITLIVGFSLMAGFGYKIWDTMDLAEAYFHWINLGVLGYILVMFMGYFDPEVFKKKEQK